MTAGEIIFAALTGDAAVVAIVAQRVFPNLAPQGTTLPTVVYQVVTQVPVSSIDGAPTNRITQARVQVDCYSRRYLEAQQLAVAVHNAVGSLATPQASAWLESQRDLYDNETQYHRVSMDFSVWF